MFDQHLNKNKMKPDTEYEKVSIPCEETDVTGEEGPTETCLQSFWKQQNENRKMAIYSILIIVILIIGIFIGRGTVSKSECEPKGKDTFLNQGEENRNVTSSIQSEQNGNVTSPKQIEQNGNPPMINFTGVKIDFIMTLARKIDKIEVKMITKNNTAVRIYGTLQNGRRLFEKKDRCNQTCTNRVPLDEPLDGGEKMTLIAEPNDEIIKSDWTVELGDID